MSKVEVNQISSQCGSTLTIGQSGDTVTLACGATQSGFGRTGTVDWQTGSIKTATFTATSGEGYFCNTSGGAFTVNLPSSPSVGDIVAVKDYAGTFDTNNLTLGRGGSNIEGLAADKVLGTQSLSITFVYADATKGWLAVNDMAQSQVPKFITATGGTITCCGDYKIHTFTGPGTFCVSCAGNSIGSNEVSYMVVAGGAGGGGTNPGSGPYSSGGGGGAGGFREGKSPQTPYTASPLDAGSGLSVTVQGYPIVVGGGGSASPTASSGGQGNNSSFSTITSAGGGYGTGRGSPGPGAGPGGSGGGGSGLGCNSNSTGGSGNTPPTSPAQGFDGGNGSLGPYCSTGANGGGGGGATAVGVAAIKAGGGNGGAGATTSINNTPTAYAGGGGGGVYVCGSDGASGSGTGGTGGGGPGGPGAGSTTPGNGQAGTDNTGGGGGGGSTQGPDSTARSGAAGGSGIVIIRYKYQ
jgi:hypothetical protein